MQSWTAGSSLYSLQFCALAVFPDGRLPSRRWRVVPATLLLAVVALMISFAVAPTIQDGYVIANPLPLPKASFTQGGPVEYGIALLALAGCAGCLAVPRRSSGSGAATPCLRRQIGWYAYGNAINAHVLIVLAWS